MPQQLTWVFLQWRFGKNAPVFHGFLRMTSTQVAFEVGSVPVFTDFQRKNWEILILKILNTAKHLEF